MLLEVWIMGMNSNNPGYACFDQEKVKGKLKEIINQLQTLYTKNEVKKFLKLQRHECQIERNKRSVHKNGVWYVACDDIIKTNEPEEFKNN